MEINSYSYPEGKRLLPPPETSAIFSLPTTNSGLVLDVKQRTLSRTTPHVMITRQQTGNVCWRLRAQIKQLDWPKIDQWQSVGRAASWVPEVEFSPFRVLTRRLVVKWCSRPVASCCYQVTPNSYPVAIYRWLFMCFLGWEKIVG